MVTVSMDGHKHLKALRIAPDVVDPADIEMLQDLILAAVNDARTQVEEKLKGSLGGMAGGMPGGFPFGGI
jgi:DNA-binding YbaB/EbfC family protein